MGTEKDESILVFNSESGLEEVTNTSHHTFTQQQFVEVFIDTHMLAVVEVMENF